MLNLEQRQWDSCRGKSVGPGKSGGTEASNPHSISKIRFSDIHPLCPTCRIEPNNQIETLDLMLEEMKLGSPPSNVWDPCRQFNPGGHGRHRTQVVDLDTACSK